MIRTIPEDFLIGTSSSAWQIEGVAGKSKEQKSWAGLFYASAPEKWHNGIGPEKAADFLSPLQRGYSYHGISSYESLPLYHTMGAVYEGSDSRHRG